MRILVTGGTGFIGRHLLNEIAGSDDELCIVVRAVKDDQQFGKDVQIIVGDLKDVATKDKIKTFSPETVYHLAWDGIPDYSLKMSLNNLFLNLELLMFFGEIGVDRVIATGSCWEYGTDQGQLSENMALVTNNAFTTAKSSILEMGKKISEEYDFVFVWARLFYVYGPGQSGHSLLPSLIRMGLSGVSPEARTPWASNDFVYVKDVTKVLVAMSGSDFESGVYNIGSGSAVKIHDITRIIAEKLGFQISANFNNEPSSIKNPNFWADVSKLKNKISFEPTSLESGLEDSINAFSVEE